MFTIPIIENPKWHYTPILYYKTKSRTHTLTDISIVSKELIVVIHRFAGKVYLIKLEYDDTGKVNKYHLLDSIKIKYGNDEYQTEMLTRKDNRLYIITYTSYLVIVDIIDNKNLKFIKELKLVEGTCYHGLEINNNNLYIVPAIVEGPMHIIKMSLNPENINYQFEKIVTPEFKMNNGNYRIKDITFLSNGNIILPIILKNEKSGMLDYNHSDNGFIGLYNSNFKLLDKLLLKDIQMDSIIADKNDNFYLTVQDSEGGFIYKGNIKCDRLENIKKIKVADFPHGIDINEEFNLLGYTSYGTSSAYLCNLDEL
jgi:hypothetical protein